MTWMSIRKTSETACAADSGREGSPRVAGPRECGGRQSRCGQWAALERRGDARSPRVRTGIPSRVGQEQLKAGRFRMSKTARGETGPRRVGITAGAAAEARAVTRKWKRATPLRQRQGTLRGLGRLVPLRRPADALMDSPTDDSKAFQPPLHLTSAVTSAQLGEKENGQRGTPQPRQV